MHAIDARRELRVATIHRERVLREVVGADREEIDFGGELVGEQRRRRGLDHHAQRDGGYAEFRALLVEHAPDGAHLGDVRDHRQQYAARAAGTQQRPQLRLEQVRAPQAGADAAQAERRVLLRRHR